MIHKLLLVTGTMRTGTTWMSQALRLNGLDCPHEHLGEDGCVSWFYAIDAPTLPARPDKRYLVHRNDKPRRAYKFGTVVHLVREPLKVLLSMTRAMLTYEQEWLVDNGMITSMDRKPKFWRTLEALINMNAEVEKIADFRFQLEDLTRHQEPWDQLGERLKMKLVRPRLGVRNRTRGFYRQSYRKPTWKQLAQMDPILTHRLRQMGQRYGYY